MFLGDGIGKAGSYHENMEKATTDGPSLAADNVEVEVPLGITFISTLVVTNRPYLRRMKMIQVGTTCFLDDVTRKEIEKFSAAMQELQGNKISCPRSLLKSSWVWHQVPLKPRTETAMTVWSNDRALLILAPEENVFIRCHWSWLHWLHSRCNLSE